MNKTLATLLLNVVSGILSWVLVRLIQVLTACAVVATVLAAGYGAFELGRTWGRGDEPFPVIVAPPPAHERCPHCGEPLNE